jgi:uncharacterized membrane protein
MKLLGHYVHPMLIVFPLGLLATAAGFDVAAIVSGTGLWSDIAFWLIAVGIVTGLLAAVFGLIDFLRIPTGTRARRVGVYHGLGNVVVVGLFAGSWLLRRDDPRTVEAAAYALSFGGVGLAAFTGWLGGELVERLGVGVDEGANLNAPSSLSGQPAERSRPM